MIDKTLARNICVLRKNAGFTQRNLADFLGVHQSLISKIEKGQRNISVESAEKLSSLFCVTLKQLESKHLEAPRLSSAFRGRKFNLDEMNAISAINKIALNVEFMDSMGR